MSRVLTQEQIVTIRRLIDRGEWKHSWHLPQTSSGAIDWWNPATTEKCLSVLAEMKTECLDVIKRIEQVDVACANHLEYLKEMVKEDAEGELNDSSNGLKSP